MHFIKDLIGIMSTKRQKAANAALFIDRALELPVGTISGGATLILHSDREVIVDGCRGVISCSEDMIKVNIGNRAVCITGRSLMIKSLTDREIIIAGCILSIEFC